MDGQTDSWTGQRVNKGLPRSKYGWGPKIKSGAADLPKRPIADKFLHGTLVPTDQHTEFQISTVELCSKFAVKPYS